MKKILLFLLLLNTITVFAQIEKGKWIGGITLSGRNGSAKNNSTQYKDNASSLNLDINKIINRKIFLGINLNYDYAYNFNESVNQYNSSKKNLYGIGLNAVYYKILSKYLFCLSKYQFNYVHGNNSLYWSNATTQEYNEEGISLIFKPLNISFILYKEIVVGVNLINILYSDTKVNLNTSNDKNKIHLFEYSLNPIQNGITFSYILK